MPAVLISVKQRVCLLLLTTLVPGVVGAFGAKAHRIAGLVAADQLCAEAMQVVKNLTPAGSLAEAGLWADHIRADPDWDFARPWHYINVPDESSVTSVLPTQKGDVLSAIQFFYAQLSDPNVGTDKQLVAFYFLVHFVVDIHQPLHVGRQSDLGGNLTDVWVGAVGGELDNLHRYWDSGVFESVTDIRGYATELAQQYREQIAKWQSFSPLDWATESKSLRTEVYSFRRDSADIGILDARYQAMAENRVRERLVQAGTRLAGLLNSLWCHSPRID